MSVNYLGGCCILEEIGRGGTGTVYRAERRGEAVALKVLADEWARDPAATERFLQEGRLLARLSHPGIVKVHDVGREAGKFYMVLEFVEGPPLSRAIARHAFTPVESARLVSAVARALHHAHRHGVIHGDIGPSNILLKGDGSPKITDFGIARLRTMAPGRWQSGVTAGTPVYMSPEQAAALSDIIDVRTDVYSLGAVLYEAVTGRAPFSGKTTAEILEKVVREAPPAPRRVEPSLAPELERVILKAMSKDPAGRFSSAGELADAIEGWARRQPDLFGGSSS